MRQQEDIWPGTVWSDEPQQVIVHSRHTLRWYLYFCFFIKSCINCLACTVYWFENLEPWHNAASAGPFSTQHILLRHAHITESTVQLNKHMYGVVIALYDYLKICDCVRVSVCTILNLISKLFSFIVWNFHLMIWNQTCCCTALCFWCWR